MGETILNLLFALIGVLRFIIYIPFQKVLAMGVATPIAMVTAAIQDDVEDRGNTNPSSFQRLTKRSPVNPLTLPLKFAPLKLLPFAALEAKGLLTLKMAPTALKKAPIVLKKGSLPIQKAFKKAPIVLKKGSLPIQKVLKTVPLELAKGSLAVKKVIKTAPLALAKGSLPIKKVLTKAAVVGGKCLFLCGFLG